MVFGFYLKKYWKFCKIFQTNVETLIKIHILCFINFSIALIVFEKSDEKVYDMKHCRVLGGFFQTRWGKPNAPHLCYNISNSHHIYVFQHADYKYNSKNCQTADFHSKNHEKPMKMTFMGF